MNHEVTSDGRVVWVNSAETGMCLGRFGRGGIDIHHDIEMQKAEGKQCLHCTHTLPTEKDWHTFVTKMKEHYEVSVGEEHRPKWLSP